MNRRTFLKSVGVIGSSVAMNICPSPLLAAAKAESHPNSSTSPMASAVNKPNVILIMADDLGYECIGANGGTSYKTPAIDKLAQAGMRFEHCYSQPLCTPSRVEIMTGIYNVRNYVRFGVLDRNETTFAHLFKEQGYATCIAGKWQLGNQPDSPQHFGFDQWCLWQHTKGRTDVQGHDTRYPNPRLDINGKLVRYTDGQYGPAVECDFVCDFIQQKKKEPFFIYYPMVLTHCPFVPTPDSDDWDLKDKGCKEYKGDPMYFGDMVSYMDKIVGRIIAKINELGLTDNTLVLFTGDNGTDSPIISMMNGIEVKGEKGKTTNGGTHVPLIAYWPGIIKPGQVSDELVDFSDFLPTICEAAGIAVPASLNIDGKSFLPQLRGSNEKRRDWIYCWYSPDGDKEKARVFARNQRYKLYHNGEFYDISKDIMEKTPLQESELDDNTRLVKEKLQTVIDTYQGKTK